MPNILDQVAASRSASTFRPQDIREFFALTLARKLQNPVDARHYLSLVDIHSEERLLAVYREVAPTVKPGGDTRKRVEAVLERIHDKGRPARIGCLAFKIERRSISAAVFFGTQLDYTQTLHLTSSREQAEASAVGFVNSILSHFTVESACLERISESEIFQRATLSRLVKAALAEHGLPVSEIEKHDFLTAYGYPSPRSRREMREAVRMIWPVLKVSVGILDAVGLGLYAQTERLFGPDD